MITDDLNLQALANLSCFVFSLAFVLVLSARDLLVGCQQQWML
jgi:hypothetical protein